MVQITEEPNEQDFRDAGLSGDIGAPPAITPLDPTAGSPAAALAVQIQDMDAYINYLQGLLEASTDLVEQTQLQTAIDSVVQQRGQTLTAYNNAVGQERQIARDTVWAEQQTLDRELTAQQNRISNDLERGRLSFQQAQEQFSQQLGLAREKLAQQEALARYADWAMPEGLEFHPGYEPGGAASTAMGLLGAKFTPVPVRRIDFNPVGELPSPTVAGASQYTPGTQLPSPGTGAGLGAAMGASAGLRAASLPSVLSNRSPYWPPYTPPPAGQLGGTAGPFYPNPDYGPNVPAGAGISSSIQPPPDEEGRRSVWSDKYKRWFPHLTSARREPVPMPPPSGGGDIGSAGEFPPAPMRTSPGYYGPQAPTAGQKMAVSTATIIRNAPKRKIGDTTYYLVFDQWIPESHIVTPRG